MDGMMNKEQLNTWATRPILILGRTPALPRVAASPSDARPLSLEEAEILIYLLPEAHELRRQSMDVSWELENGEKLNQSDFFIFWVTNAKRPHHEGSVTVGHFGINKHNAEIWSLDGNQFVSTPEIEGAQKIIRRANSMDQSVIQQYHSRRPDILPGGLD